MAGYAGYIGSAASVRIGAVASEMRFKAMKATPIPPTLRPLF
jgi:hypothetical protein